MKAKALRRVWLSSIKSVYGSELAGVDVAKDEKTAQSINQVVDPERVADAVDDAVADAVGQVAHHHPGVRVLAKVGDRPEPGDDKYG